MSSEESSRSGLKFAASWVLESESKSVVASKGAKSWDKPKSEESSSSSSEEASVGEAESEVVAEDADGLYEDSSEVCG
jgi:hypothetical protein